MRRRPTGAWCACEAVPSDWKALDAAHLETYHAAMMALAAELRREVPLTLS
jgi:hypothetical protein